MHALERNERPDAFAPHRLESATGVAHAVFRETAADKIGNPAGEAFDERVLALRAIAANQIGAALDLGEKARNVGRIVLQIAIDENDHGAASGVGAGIHGCALAGIFFELQNAHPRCIRQASDRAIDRAVIDKDNFVRQIGESSRQFRLEDGHVLLLVVKRHNDRDSRSRGCAIHNDIVR